MAPLSRHGMRWAAPLRRAPAAFCEGVRLRALRPEQAGTGPLYLQLVDRSLHDAAVGLEPVRALQHLRAAALSPADAVHSELPVMATVRQGFRAADRPVAFTRSIYRADRYDFVAEMGMGQG